VLIEDLRDAHRWLDELLCDSRLTLESLASREGKTVRSIRMTVSLAFLAPEIVKGAVEGPRTHTQFGYLACKMSAPGGRKDWLYL
jgi:hypothetical protein